jgi:hypothetical protein
MELIYLNYFLGIFNLITALLLRDQITDVLFYACLVSSFCSITWAWYKQGQMK